MNVAIGGPYRGRSQPYTILSFMAKHLSKGYQIIELFSEKIKWCIPTLALLVQLGGPQFWCPVACESTQWDPFLVMHM